jgi:hypothetical protein
MRGSPRLNLALFIAGTIKIRDSVSHDLNVSAFYQGFARRA